MKIKTLLLLLTAVLPISYAYANDQQLSSYYLQPLPSIIYDVTMTSPPMPMTELRLNNIQLMQTQSSLDRMKTKLDTVKVNMRYFLKKDILKKNGMRPIIRRKSITLRYTYRW